MPASYINKGQVISIRLSGIQALVYYLFFLSVHFNLNANSKKDSLLAVLEKSGENQNRADVLNLLAAGVLDDDYNLAIGYGDEALKLSRKLNYRQGLFKSNYILGRIHANYTLNFSKAMVYFTNALRLCEINNQQQKANIFSQLAFVNKRQRNIDKAIYYYKASIQIAEANNNLKEVSGLSAYLAEVYEEKHDKSNTLFYLKKVFEIEKQTNFKNTSPAVFVSIARFYELQNQFGPAETYLLDALKIFEMDKNLRWVSYTNGLLSQIYLQKKDYSAALAYADKGLKLAVDHKLNKEIADNHFFLTAIYDSLKDYKNAYVHLAAFKNIEDSVFDLEKIREIANIQSFYEANVKEENIVRATLQKELSESKLKKTQLAMGALLIVLVLAVILAVILSRNYKVKQIVNEELMHRDELKTLKLDEIIKQLNKEIIEHQKTKTKLEVINAELNNFMYCSSHDLKGPLNSIAGLTNLATSNVSEKERLEYIAMISRSATRLNVLIDDLVLATRVTHGNIEPSTINLAEFAKEIIDDLKNSETSKGVEFILDIESNLEINTDKILLRSILHNLVENAAKYKSTLKGTPFVKLTAYKEKRDLKITVADNGQGILEANKATVFDMFTRANKTVPGTGLGLYLVKKSVAKLGGTIYLESIEHEGSKFEITLPDLIQVQAKLQLFDI